jgi:hypothetical protein
MPGARREPGGRTSRPTAHIAPTGSAPVDEAERELLTGMGNCYAACGEDFEGTVGMVAQARHRSPEDVKAALEGMRARYREDAEYRRLRGRLPDGFPL